MTTQWPEKKLGFGLMRLPKDDNGAIDHQQVCSMADAYLSGGFTYFDTAYVYGGSEEAFRKAVVERYPRESFTVVSKLAAWELREDYGPADMFQESLNRCGITYFDYYLLHSLQESNIHHYTDDVWACLDACDPGASSAAFALRFAASLPGVKVVLSGMSKEQLEDNVSVFRDFRPCPSGKRRRSGPRAGRRLHSVRPV